MPTPARSPAPSPAASAKIQKQPEGARGTNSGVIIIKDVCNPCCCVPFKISAFVAGGILVAASFTTLIAGTNALPPPRGCEIFRNAFFTACEEFQGRRSFMSVMIVVAGVLWLVAGVATIGSALVNFHWTALIATILTLLGLLAYLTLLGLMGEGGANYYHYFDYYKILGADTKKELSVGDHIGAMAGIGIGIIIILIASIWLTLFCYQFWKYMRFGSYKPLLSLKFGKVGNDPNATKKTGTGASQEGSSSSGAVPRSNEVSQSQNQPTQSPETAVAAPPDQDPEA